MVDPLTEQLDSLGVDYEMAGKDLIDSVTQSSKICRALGKAPPEGFNYELFLDGEGQKITSFQAVELPPVPPGEAPVQRVRVSTNLGPEARALFGEDDDDIAYGGGGGDSIDGGFGNDELHGDAGVDWLYGSFGDDFLYGGADGDALFGQEGQDTLNGDDGDDSLDGGAGVVVEPLASVVVRRLVLGGTGHVAMLRRQCERRRAVGEVGDGPVDARPAEGAELQSLQRGYLTLADITGLDLWPTWRWPYCRAILPFD